MYVVMLELNWEIKCPKHKKKKKDRDPRWWHVRQNYTNLLP